MYENKENMDKMDEEKADIFGNMTPVLQKSMAFDEQITLSNAFATDFCQNLRLRRATYRARPWAGGAGHGRMLWCGEYPQAGLTSPQIFRLLHKISAGCIDAQLVGGSSTIDNTAMPTATATERSVPHNLEAERALLGSVLLDNGALNFALELLGKEDFYSEAHRLAFEKMSEISEKNRTIDLVTLSEELAKGGLLEKAGGAAYLASLTDGVPIGTMAAMGEYCRIVKEKSTIRRLINASNNTIARCLEGTDDPETLIDLAQSQVFEIAEHRVQSGFATIREIVKSSFGKIDVLFDRGQRVTGIETGLEDLDNITSGLQAGELVVIAARPSLGKTALALNIAAHAAINHRKVVGMFSLEMSKESLVIRLLCSEARIDSHKLRTGFSSKEDWNRMTPALGASRKRPSTSRTRRR